MVQRSGAYWNAGAVLFGLSPEWKSVAVIRHFPLLYRKMLSLTDGAAAVLTDSGGMQELNRRTPRAPTRTGMQESFAIARETALLDGSPGGLGGWAAQAGKQVVAALCSAPSPDEAFAEAGG